MTGKQLTIGILGHVDHGKTSLVKALTGVDTDRLEEEKRRGLTIVLGFAYLNSKKGSIDLIDVPGHESFIRTMIAGATGLNGIMLIVAANEGIKPQTKEHFDIARLLGINRGLIAITKTDLVDNNQLDTVKEQVKEFVKNSFLANAPVFPVSTGNETSISALHTALLDMLENTEAGRIGDYFNLPMDRVFTIDGFGTVGTGTLRNGKIISDDEVEIMPMGFKTNVREIQVHNTKVSEALPGQRVAINLRGIKRDQMQRGDILIRPGSIKLTSNIYAKLHILNNVQKIPKRNESLRLLFGATDVIAKIKPLDNERLEAGADILVHIRIRNPIIAGTGEHFIIRSCSNMETIGGGEFLETTKSLSILPLQVLTDHLGKLEKASVKEKVIQYVNIAETMGINIISLIERTVTTRLELISIIKNTDIMLIEDSVAINRAAFDLLSNKALQLLNGHHKVAPSQIGLQIEKFRSSFSDVSNSVVVEFLLEKLSGENKIIINDGNVRLTDFNQKASLSEADRELINAIEQLFRDSGTETPSLKEATGTDAGKIRAYEYLKESGKLIPLKDSQSRKLFVFHADTIENIKQNLIKEFPPPKKFTVSEAKSLIDSTRKYVVPILEYFDRSHLTIRRGNYRSVSLQNSTIDK